MVAVGYVGGVVNSPGRPGKMFVKAGANDGLKDSEAGRSKVS